MKDQLLKNKKKGANGISFTIAFYSALWFDRRPHTSDVMKHFPTTEQNLALPSYSQDLQGKTDGLEQPNLYIARQGSH